MFNSDVQGSTPTLQTADDVISQSDSAWPHDANAMSFISACSDSGQ